MRRVAMVTAVALVLVLPGSVLASAYSPVTFYSNWVPPGYSAVAAACDQSGS